MGFAERLYEGQKLRGDSLLVDYAHRDRISAFMLLSVGYWRQGMSLPRMFFDNAERDGVGEKRGADPIRCRGVADEAVDRSGDR